MRRIHTLVSVRGLLAQRDKDLENIAPFLIVDGKRLKTAQEARYFLEKELAEGHEYIPATDFNNNHGYTQKIEQTTTQTNSLGTDSDPAELAKRIEGSVVTEEMED